MSRGQSDALRPCPAGISASRAGQRRWHLNLTDRGPSVGRRVVPGENLLERPAVGSCGGLRTGTVRALGPALPRASAPCELGFPGRAVGDWLGLWEWVAGRREVPVPGELRDQLRRVAGLRGGVLVGPCGVAEPGGVRCGGDCRRDVGALVIGEAAVDVGGGLRACPVVGRCAVRGLEAGELAGGEDGFGGVPVGQTVPSAQPSMELYRPETTPTTLPERSQTGAPLMPFNTSLEEIAATVVPSSRRITPRHVPLA